MLRIVGVRGIADVVDGLQDVTEFYAAVVPADAGPVGRIVDLYIEHARQLRHVAFVQPDAGRTGDAFQDQRRFPLLSPVVRTKVFWISG